MYGLLFRNYDLDHFTSTQWWVSFVVAVVIALIYLFVVSFLVQIIWNQVAYSITGRKEKGSISYWHAFLLTLTSMLLFQ